MITAQITITCETAGTLLQHLTSIKETIRIRSRDDLEHKFEVGTHFKADTAVGSYHVTITNDGE